MQPDINLIIEYNVCKARGQLSFPNPRVGVDGSLLVVTCIQVIINEEDAAG